MSFFFFFLSEQFLDSALDYSNVYFGALILGPVLETLLQSPESEAQAFCFLLMFKDTEHVPALLP